MSDYRENEATIDRNDAIRASELLKLHGAGDRAMAQIAEALETADNIEIE